MKKKHGFTNTHVEVHDDGSASIHHVHMKGPDHDMKHAVADLDGVHDCLEDHLNPEESEKHEAMEEKVAPGIHDKVAEMMGKGE